MTNYPGSEFPDNPGAPQRSTIGASFFQSIRNSPWRRPEDRWIGGVCSSVAMRLGWDVTLVRGISIIIALLGGGLLLLLYALAWALIPEQRDGRIHLEELLAGQPDIAHFGIALLILSGATGGVRFGFHFTGDSTEGILVDSFIAILFTVIAIGVVIALLVRNRRTPRPPSNSHPPYPGAGPSPYSAHPYSRPHSHPMQSPSQNTDSYDTQRTHSATQGTPAQTARAPYVPHPQSATDPHAAGSFGSVPSGADAPAPSADSGHESDIIPRYENDLMTQAEPSSSPEPGIPDPGFEAYQNGSGAGEATGTSQPDYPSHDGGSAAVPSADSGYPAGLSHEPTTANFTAPSPHSPRLTHTPSAPHLTAPAYAPAVPAYQHNGPGLPTFLSIVGLLLIIGSITWLVGLSDIQSGDLFPAGTYGAATPYEHFFFVYLSSIVVGSAFFITGTILVIRALRGKPGTWLTLLSAVAAFLLPLFVLIVGSQVDSLMMVYP
ncbi:MAG: PspC domain-containing protein [Actinomycetaceae bacterium]|nr:PspC domain-containing protein [Actinomycetaceae bacterium]